MTHDARPAAQRVLVQAFWTTQGWRRPALMPAGSEWERALDSGLFFAEERSLDHDGWVAAARRAAAAVSLPDVSDAFVASLTSRRLDLRSALGSYAVARHLPSHRIVVGASGRCQICGLHETSSQDLNVLNFERFKWGGVRRDDVRYLAFDLEQFLQAPKLTPSEVDVQTGRELLGALSAAAESETSTTAESLLRMLKGNAAERLVVVDILGVCGVLADGIHPSYRESFVAAPDRELPAQHFVDRAYPACWWRGRDGVSGSAVGEFLPSLV